MYSKAGKVSVGFGKTSKPSMKKKSGGMKKVSFGFGK